MGVVPKVNKVKKKGDESSGAELSQTHRTKVEQGSHTSIYPMRWIKGIKKGGSFNREFNVEEAPVFLSNAEKLSCPYTAPTKKLDFNECKQQG